MRSARIAALAITAILNLGFASSAHADDFGLGGQLPDDLNHSFCMDFPLERPENAFFATLIFWGLLGAVGPTDYTATYDPICTPETDILFELGYAYGYAGMTTCVRSADGRCHSFVITIDPQLVTSEHDMVSLSCHEVGHTLGLDDGPSTDPWYSDCMATDFTWSETLNQHHIDHVNSRVPYGDPADN